MKMMIATALAAATLAGGALAEGDVDAGKKAFGKCKSCHMIQDAAGTDIVKGGRTGPNLFGVIGRPAGSYEGFNYSDDMKAAGAAGLVWDEASFTSFVQDPAAFLSDHLDKNARSAMSFRLRKGAEDVYAYLVSVSQ